MSSIFRVQQQSVHYCAGKIVCDRNVTGKQRSRHSYISSLDNLMIKMSLARKNMIKFQSCI